MTPLSTLLEFGQQKDLQLCPGTKVSIQRNAGVWLPPGEVIVAYADRFHLWLAASRASHLLANELRGMWLHNLTDPLPGRTVQHDNKPERHAVSHGVLPGISFSLRYPPTDERGLLKHFQQFSCVE